MEPPINKTSMEEQLEPTVGSQTPHRPGGDGIHLNGCDQFVWGGDLLQ